ncbi:sporulation-delaying protein SdpB family protein [Ornithinimicrobium pratense]|uniref:HTTM-like domain-containing protein n=1 Tax=Ornithinimicrobium pratense TaxID=2593973 RepID=A0A5J6V8N8_9MICO|nr:sporulation-delaying protein SdpB family protein [Ornithinimicrobium pratense]QFG69461.1 hypothetical protein FY030_12775 [Ornithinimicrobium pratense]
MLRRWLFGSVVLDLPWGSWLGLARTLMALGTAGTLALSGADVLFSPVVGLPLAPACEGLGALSIFCLLPREQLSLLKWVCVVILLVVASGWRPRWTALAHWWVAFSVFNSVAITDGGDQASIVLTTLLLPVLLTDDRRWHWQRSPRTHAAATATPARPRTWAVALAVVALLAIKLQVAVIYFQASVAKLGQPEWVDGTSMYYWMSDDIFGPAAWMRPLMDAVVDQQLLLLTLTWLPLVVEFLLALSLLLPQWSRWGLLLLGVSLHLSIAVTMGLWSFSLVMVGACILLLTPPGADLQEVGPAWRRWRDRLRVQPEHDRVELLPAAAGPR